MFDPLITYITLLPYVHHNFFLAGWYFDWILLLLLSYNNIITAEKRRQSRQGFCSAGSIFVVFAALLSNFQITFPSPPILKEFHFFVFCNIFILSF